MKKYIFPLCLLSLLACLSCEPKHNEFVNIIFEIPFTIRPAKDTINVGDTLWLEASFPDTVKDHNSSTYYYIPPSYDFKTRIGFFKLISPINNLGDQPGFSSGFDFVSKVGNITDLGLTFGSVKYEYIANKYTLMIGIIPKQKGAACINFLNGRLAGGVYERNDELPFIDLGKNSAGARIIPVLDDIYYIINEGNTNFDLFQKNCQAVSLTNPIEVNVYYEQKGTFTFIVK